MTSVGLDSEASFASRAKEVGMSDLLLQAFQTANLKTYGSLAFVCPYKPDQTDEGPLFDAIEALIGRAPTAGEKIPIRRLFFEAHTLALADLKMRFEKDDSSEPPQIPLAERMARLEQQRARLPGVHFSSETEPSHKLVDMVFQMCQDQQVVWIPWEKLVSRASEITSSKKEMHITFDAGGSLKLAKKHDTPSADLTGEIRIRQALSRRSRAFDLANLCGYQQMECGMRSCLRFCSGNPLTIALQLPCNRSEKPTRCFGRSSARPLVGVSSSCLTEPSLFSSRWKLCSMILKFNIRCFPCQKVVIVQGPMIILRKMIRAI